MTRIVALSAGVVLVALGAPLVAAVNVAVLSAGGVPGVAAAAPAAPRPPAASRVALAGIPPDYLAGAEEAGRRFGLPWTVLAGIYRLECDFGRSLLPGCNPPGTENPYGAQGPGQFLPTTWRRGLAPHEIIPPGPPTASTSQGYATDGDGDGVADPWDPADALASTARLLAANGGPATSPERSSPTTTTRYTCRRCWLWLLPTAPPQQRKRGPS